MTDTAPVIDPRDDGTAAYDGGPAEPGEVPADLLRLAVDLDVSGETPESLAVWAEAIR